MENLEEGIRLIVVQKFGDLEVGYQLISSLIFVLMASNWSKSVSSLLIQTGRFKGFM